MKELNKFITLLFAVVSIYIHTISAFSPKKVGDLPSAIECEDNYECSTGSSSLFPLGKQYVYTYSFKSMVKVEKVLSRELREDDGTDTKAINENGSLIVLPINACEFVATLESEEFPNEEILSVKVAFENGTIQRVCSSKENPAHVGINALKSFLSMLLPASSTSAFRDVVLDKGIFIERTSRGTCLTKYDNCGENNTQIKYQSNRYCALNQDESDLVESLHHNEMEFKKKISQFSEEASRICETSLFPLETLSVPQELAVCSVKRSNGIISSSTCAESHTIPFLSGKFYNSAVLNLKEENVQDVSEIDNKTKFFKTSIYQVNEEVKQDKQIDELSPDSLQNLPISTKPETEIQISALRSLFKANNGYELAIQCLDGLTNPQTSLRSIKNILMILANEANNENVMRILQTILTKDLLLGKLSKIDQEDILQKTFSTNVNAEPTKESLQFSQFMLGYVCDNNSKFSDKIKLKAVMTYSSNLDGFCTKMELLSGERFCLDMSVIEQSPLVRMTRDKLDEFSQIMLLEAVSNVHHHEYNISSCSVAYESRKKNSSLGLWSVLNCYKKRLCSREGKEFYKKLIQDETSRNNERIVAFLAMRRCFDNKDREVVKTLFENPTNNQELLTFINGYRANREFYGISDPFLPLQNRLATTDIKENSSQPTAASNSLAVLKLPYINTQLQFETNMLYFDEPAIIPELITLSLTAIHKSQTKRVFEVEIFVDDLRNEAPPQSPLNFKITIIVKRFGRTVYIKEMTISHETLLHLFHTLKSLRKFDENQANILVQKLDQLIMDPVNVDIFDLQSLLQGKAFIPTISGIPYELSWKVDSILRFLINKNNCTDLFSNHNGGDDGSCNLVIKPKLNLDGQISLSFGSGPVTRKHSVLRGNLNSSFPIRIGMIRSKEGTEETVKLEVPSMSFPIVRFNADFKELVGDVITSSKQCSFGLGPLGISRNISSIEEETVRFMEFSVTKDRNTNTLKAKIMDEQYEVSLQSSVTDDYTYNLMGNVTLFQDKIVKKNYTMQVAFQNTQDSKKLLGKVIKNGHEYSLDAYYNRKIKNRDVNRHHGFLSCGIQEGTGILCFWPFCEFCGTEYFIGATVNTPRFKNLDLFKLAVTQVFPKEKINLVFKSEGIPLLKKIEVKVSISHGNNTNIIQNIRVRDTINEKLKIVSSSSHPEQNESGDALPESLSAGNALSTTLYSLDTQFFSQVLGQTGASFTYLLFPAYEQISYESRLLCGEILYPSKNWRQQEYFSLLSTFLYLEKNVETDKPSGYTSDINFRSSQFPVVNTDLNIRYQYPKPETLGERIIIVFRPVNLIRGEVKMEIIDYSKKDEYQEESESFLSKLFWNNIHLNQTYKVSLPDPLTVKILKGKVILKRVDSVLQAAGVEVFVGVDGALELKYDFLPENKNAVEILTSVTTAGETYGMYHHIEPVGNSLALLQDGGDVAEDSESRGHKYSGTYVLGEKSWKATGIFQSKKGREILPFSKFDIRVDSIEDKEVGVRIFGSETVQQEKIHNITVGANMGNSSLFEFRNEINPLETVPIKANLFVKHYGELKFTDSSKLANKRNLHVKARWFPKKQLIVGKIAFPTSLVVSPLYLDFNVAVADENDKGNLLFEMASRSTLNFQKSFNVTTNNLIQVKDLKWEAGLEGLFIHENEYGRDSDDIWQYNYLHVFSLSIQYVLPSLEKYAIEIERHYSGDKIDSNRKHNLKLHRPHVIPMQIYFNVDMKEEYENMVEQENDVSLFNSTTYINETFQFIACHKDNFLYIFPKLNFDYNVVGHKEINKKLESFHERQLSTSFDGKLTCQSKGSNHLPLCNDINMSFDITSKYHRDYVEPWIANVKVVNDLENCNDELSVKLVTIYEPVKEVSNITTDIEDDNSLLYEFINTVFRENVLRNRYNIEYQLHRIFTESSNENWNGPFGLAGTYIFTKMYESWNYFEFTDHHKWKSINCGDFHIWTSIVNHTTNANAEQATFSSQYVSLGESSRHESNEGSDKNITWMELQTSMNINGFGSLRSLVEQPSLLITSYEGDIEVDFLVRTEFSPVRALRVTVSHEHSTSENEEDDSLKYDLLTKLNGMLNDIELSGANSLTFLMGKLLAMGNSLTGRFGSTDGNYEYITVKVFGVSQSHPDNDRDKLFHFDISSSLTNADDDETDVRIVNDVIYCSPLNELPLIRFAFVENSTDIDLERNVSILLYKPMSKENNIQSRLPINIISENLNELSLTQLSVQGMAQQIVDDYYNETGLDTECSANEELWHDYNLEMRYRYNVQGNASNVLSNVRWFDLKENIFHCQSMVDVCYDIGENSTEHRIDTSNYCNLLLFPLEAGRSL